MLLHHGLRVGVEVVDEDDGVVGEALGREHLTEGHDVAVAQLLPLLDQAHAFRVDESEKKNLMSCKALKMSFFNMYR